MLTPALWRVQFVSAADQANARLGSLAELTDTPKAAAQAAGIEDEADLAICKY